MIVKGRKDRGKKGRKITERAIAVNSDERKMKEGREKKGKGRDKDKGHTK